MNPKALPENIVRAISLEDRKALGIKTMDERFESFVAKEEADIQRIVEAYCRHHGFETRTPENIERGRPAAGWFIHLHKAKGNPILLDVLLLHNSGEFLEMELKTSVGRLTHDQERLVEYGGSLARSATEAIRIINRWILDKGLKTAIR